MVLDQNNEINVKIRQQEAKKKNIEILCRYLNINKFFDSPTIDAIRKNNQSALDKIRTVSQQLDLTEEYLYKEDLKTHMLTNSEISTKILNGYNYFKQEEND